MKLKAGDKVYDVAVLDQLTLLQTLGLTKALREYPFNTTFEAVKDMLGRSRAENLKLPKDQLEVEALIALSVMVWSARSLAGERISLSDAIDVPIDSIDYLDDDGKPLEAVDEPDDDPGKAPAPQGLAPVAGNRAARRAATPRKTGTSRGSSTAT